MIGICSVEVRIFSRPFFKLKQRAVPPSFLAYNEKFDFQTTKVNMIYTVFEQKNYVTA